MKYSVLPISELEKLERQFVDFLVVNGITGEDWQKLKKEDAKAQYMIESFSDVIWEGVLQRCQYLVKVGDMGLLIFQFGAEQASLLTVTVSETVMNLEDWLDPSIEAVVQFQEKKYSSDRSAEIFRLIQQGGQISDGQYYRHWALRMVEN